MGSKKAGHELLNALTQQYSDCFVTDDETLKGAVTQLKNGSTLVVLPTKGVLPPDHLTHVAPNGFDIGVGTERTGSTLSMVWKISERPSRCGCLIQPIAKALASAVLICAMLYLFIHWGKPVERLGLQFPQLIGVSHSVLTYGSLAVLVVIPTVWCLLARRHGSRNHRKAD